MSAALITRFYAAFGARDHAAMARCYAPDAHYRIRRQAGAALARAIAAGPMPDLLPHPAEAR